MRLYQSTTSRTDHDIVRPLSTIAQPKHELAAYDTIWPLESVTPPPQQLSGARQAPTLAPAPLAKTYAIHFSKDKKRAPSPRNGALFTCVTYQRVPVAGLRR